MHRVFYRNERLGRIRFFCPPLVNIGDRIQIDAYEPENVRETIATSQATLSAEPHRRSPASGTTRLAAGSFALRFQKSRASAEEFGTGLLQRGPAENLLAIKL
jgi:hypothetical protein